MAQARHNQLSLKVAHAAATGVMAVAIGAGSSATPQRFPIKSFASARPSAPTPAPVVVPLFAPPVPLDSLPTNLLYDELSAASRRDPSSPKVFALSAEIARREISSAKRLVAAREADRSAREAEAQALIHALEALVGSLT
jgi:hypothetical protein